MGTTAIGLIYPDTRGAGVNWATQYEANLTLITNYLRGYLKRVDTGAWEAMQDDVLYFSLEQWRGAGTVVYCQRSSGSTKTGDVSVTPAGGATGCTVLSWSGNVKDSAGNDTQSEGWYSSSQYICALKYSSATNRFILARGTSCDDNGDPWWVVVHFTATI